MELVINANILFSIANPSSTTRYLVSNFPLSLFSPKFAKVEIIKYKEEVSKKANLKDFNSFISMLNTRINFIDLEEYKEEIEKLKNVVKDEKDIEYLALALKLRLPLWSNDKLLKEQSLVKVLNTEEIIKFLPIQF